MHETIVFQIFLTSAAQKCEKSKKNLTTNFMDYETKEYCIVFSCTADSILIWYGLKYPVKLESGERSEQSSAATISH